MTTFDLNSLNLEELLSNDELVTIDAGLAIGVGSKGLYVGDDPKAPGYTDATIIWSQIP